MTNREDNSIATVGANSIQNSVAETACTASFSAIKCRKMVVERKGEEKGYFCLNTVRLQGIKSCAESSLKH